MAGYFLGLWLGLGLILLGIEFYFFILARYIEKDLTGIEAIIFILCLVLSIGMFVKSVGSEEMFILGLFSLLPLPVAELTIKSIRTTREKIQEKIEEETDLKNWLYTIEKQPENVNAYVSVGDIYFKRKEYEKALEFYKKASSIIDMPYIHERIKITEKELLIQKGLVWVCPECSYDNKAEDLKCKVCGYSKLDRDILSDIWKHRKDLLKGSLVVIIGPLILIFLVALYIVLPTYLALIITLVAIYFTIKFFITY